RAKAEKPPEPPPLPPGGSPKEPIPQEQAARRLDELNRQLADGQARLDEMDEKFAAQQQEFRRNIISLEEKLRELEFRQNPQHEEQQRAVQNLEATHRDAMNQLRAADVALHDIEAEVRTIQARLAPGAENAEAIRATFEAAEIKYKARMKLKEDQSRQINL